jgi:hypothetical protein
MIMMIMMTMIIIINMPVDSRHILLDSNYCLTHGKLENTKIVYYSWKATHIVGPFSIM